MLLHHHTHHHRQHQHRIIAINTIGFIIEAAPLVITIISMIMTTAILALTITIVISVIITTSTSAQTKASFAAIFYRASTKHAACCAAHVQGGGEAVLCSLAKLLLSTSNGEVSLLMLFWVLRESFLHIF